MDLEPLTAERRILLAPAGAPAGEKLVRLPFEAAETVPRWPDKVGAHTEEVLAAAGVPAAQIAEILGQGSPEGEEVPAAGCPDRPTSVSSSPIRTSSPAAAAASIPARTSTW